MFSKELENLIQATLEDGVLEENKKAALIKRAEREGVDIAELEIYINSLLQKRARELENEKNAVRKQAEKEKKEAFGRKCPNCGAQVPPLTLKCECGYEFTSQKQVSSAQILSDKINEITRSTKDEEERNKLITDTINLFPVPNTREDIIEFLALSWPNAKKKGGIWGSKSGRLVVIIPTIILLIAAFTIVAKDDSITYGALFAVLLFYGALLYVPISLYLLNVDKSLLNHNKLTSVWRTKYEQVLLKGRSIRGDMDFQKQLDYYESMLKK